MLDPVVEICKFPSKVSTVLPFPLRLLSACGLTVALCVPHILKPISDAEWNGLGCTYLHNKTSWHGKGVKGYHYT